MSDDAEKPWDRPSSDQRRTPRRNPDDDTEELVHSLACLEAARRRVKPPAVALILVGLIDTALGLFVMVLGFTGAGFNMGAAEGMIGVINFLAGLAILAGGLNLLKLDSPSLVQTGSITAMVPCISLCLILGLPIGIWALVTANSPDVRAAFAANRRQRES